MPKNINEISPSQLQNLREAEVTPVEKYVAHLIDGAELTDFQQKLFLRYQYAASLALKGYSNEKVVKAIKNGNEELGIDSCSDRNARYIVQRSKEIFGEVYEVNKKFRRWASIEWYDEVARKAEKKGYYKSAIMARKQADLIAGILEKDTGLNPQDFTDPEKWNFEITVDPMVLHEAAQGDTEDLGYAEEVE